MSETEAAASLRPATVAFIGTLIHWISKTANKFLPTDSHVVSTSIMQFLYGVFGEPLSSSVICNELLNQPPETPLACIMLLAGYVYILTANGLKYCLEQLLSYANNTEPLCSDTESPSTSQPLKEHTGKLIDNEHGPSKLPPSKHIAESKCDFKHYEYRPSKRYAEKPSKSQPLKELRMEQILNNAPQVLNAIIALCNRAPPSQSTPKASQTIARNPRPFWSLLKSTFGVLSRLHVECDRKCFYPFLSALCIVLPLWQTHLAAATMCICDLATASFITHAFSGYHRIATGLSLAHTTRCKAFSFSVDTPGHVMLAALKPLKLSCSISNLFVAFKWVSRCQQLLLFFKRLILIIRKCISDGFMGLVCKWTAYDFSRHFQFSIAILYNRTVRPLFNKMPRRLAPPSFGHGKTSFPGTHGYYSKSNEHQKHLMAHFDRQNTLLEFTHTKPNRCLSLRKPSCSTPRACLPVPLHCCGNTGSKSKSGSNNNAGSNEVRNNGPGEDNGGNSDQRERDSNESSGGGGGGDDNNDRDRQREPGTEEEQPCEDETVAPGKLVTKTQISHIMQYSPRPDYFSGNEPPPYVQTFLAQCGEPSYPLPAAAAGPPDMVSQCTETFDRSRSFCVATRPWCIHPEAGPLVYT